MKEESIKKWWSSLDQDLDAEAQAAFEKSMADDPSQEVIFLQAQEIHEGLKKMEADEPSMRFSKNVLEHLPQLYKKINIEPLLAPKVLWRLAILILIMVVLSLIPAFFVEGSTESIYTEIILNFFQLSTDLPSEWMFMLALLGFGFVAYVIVDRQLNKRFLKSAK